jgi:hypothetical protein
LTIDNEVAALIIPTLSRIIYNLLLRKVGQVTKLGADHDWDLTDLNFIVLVQSLLRNNWSNTVFIGVAPLQLLYFNGDIDFSLVSQVAQTGLMGQNRFVNSVLLQVSGKLINSDIAEVDAIDCVFVILAAKLALLHNILGPKLFNHLLDAVLEEALEGENLLGNQTILFEVGVDDFPGVVLVDGIHICSIG